MTTLPHGNTTYDTLNTTPGASGAGGAVTQQFFMAGLLLIVRRRI